MDELDWGAREIEVDHARRDAVIWLAHDRTTRTVVIRDESGDQAIFAVGSEK